MTTISAAATQWLQQWLEARLGGGLLLSCDTGQSRWRLAPAGSHQQISIAIEASFYRLGPQEHLPCAAWSPASEGFSAPEQALPAPGWAGASADSLQHLLVATGEGFRIHYDIIGLAYWMLARCEEIDPDPDLLDRHQRFASTSSHAFRHGYLERPVVDEWLALLAQVAQRLWPRLQLAQHRFTMLVSHDVDAPSAYGFGSKAEVLRNMVSRLLRLGEPGRPLQALQIRRATHQQLHAADPFNTFDWLMNCSEQAGLHSAFYFICGRTNPRRDALYDLEHPAIRALMRRIHARGHEIGLHPSYDSWDDPAAIAAEAARLRAVAASEGIQQPAWGGRMHYLRWRWPTTALGWEQAGLAYDSSLGYADRPGFRCGTCHAYRMFDPVAQRTLNLVQRPLIAMEASVIDSHHLGLGRGPAALALFQRLQQRCRAVNGQFTLLWHNSHLTRSADRRLYRQLLSPA